MGLHEQAVCAGRQRSAGEDGDEIATSGGVRGIEHHTLPVQGLERGDGGEVRQVAQVGVEAPDSPFAEDDAVRPRRKEVLPRQQPLFEGGRGASLEQHPAARGPDSAYFPQHDADCNEVEWSDCNDTTEFGDCDCLAIHAWPYTLNPDPAVPPLLDSLDTDYRAVLGMLDTYAGYIVPQPDFNTHVSLLTEDGDHYEDTVSMSYLFGTKLQEGQARIDARW